MNRVIEIAQLTACLACMDTENIFALNETDLNILDYLLYPFNESYLDNVKSYKTAKICAKCRIYFGNINTLRDIVLKNGLLLFQVAQFHGHNLNDASYTHPPLSHDQRKTDDIVQQEHPSFNNKEEYAKSDQLLTEEIDIKPEVIEFKLEDCDSENLDDRIPDDNEGQIEEEIDKKLEEKNSKMCVTNANINVSNLNELVQNKQPMTYISSYTHNTPGHHVLGMPCSGIPSQNRYLNPSLKVCGPDSQQHIQVTVLAVSSGKTSPPNTNSMEPNAVMGGTEPNYGASEEETAPVKSNRKRVRYCDLPLKYECDVCGKKYPMKYSIIRHIEHVHLDIKKKCNMCKREVKKYKLNDHMRKHEHAVYCRPCHRWYSPFSYKVHIDTTPAHVKLVGYKYNCADCGMKFYFNSSLRRHRKRLHLKIEKKHKCPECPKAFEAPRYMRRHLSNAHGERPRNYVCNVCGVGLRSQQSLSAHMVRHSGARPYKCEVCDATFGYRSALYMHNRLKHQQGYEPEKKQRTKQKNKEIEQENKETKQENKETEQENNETKQENNEIKQENNET